MLSTPTGHAPRLPLPVHWARGLRGGTPGQPALIKARLRYILKGEDFGNWSPWQNWPLTGE